MKRFQKMITGVLYALLCVVLWGCGETVRDKYDRWMTELDCPVILMSKTDKAVNYPAITVRDGAGRIRTFERCEALCLRVIARTWLAQLQTVEW